MPGIEHPPYFFLVHAQPACKLCIVDTSFAHGIVKDRFSRGRGGWSDFYLASSQSASDRQSFVIADPRLKRSLQAAFRNLNSVFVGVSL